MSKAFFPILIFAALPWVALPCAAAEPKEAAPLSVEVHGLAPTSDLKDYVDRVGIGGSWSYTVYTRAWAKGSFSMAARMGYNNWSNGTTRREVHSVDFGPEFTLHPFTPYRGWYLKIAEGPSITSLTRREGEVLKEDKYARWQTVIATGWRFRNNLSVEALWQNASLDERMNLSAFGIGIRAQF